MKCVANSDGLDTCYVKTNNFETFLKELLLVKQYRVEIWKRNSSNKWSLTNQVEIFINISSKDAT